MKINVMLYGGFDKKTKNRAEIISCDKCENCSFYRKKTCLKVSQAFSESCKFGERSVVTGYTQRAKARYDFDNKYKNDECYGKLNHPSDWRVGLIENVAVFNLTYAICDTKRWNNMKHEWEETGKYMMRETGPFSVGTYSYIPLEELDAEIVNCILKYRPMTIFDHSEIKEYKNKIVPNILFELSKLMPEKYEELINKYPEFKDIAPNFVGRKALIKTLPEGTVLKDRGTFVKENGYLKCDCWKSAFLPFNSSEAEIKIKITDTMKCEITSNSQVDENTEFV